MKDEVSVIIATFNPDIVKLIRTFKSVVQQKEITVEIIIADDGSTDVDLQTIKDTLKKYSKNVDCKMISLPENMGTVCNIHNAVKQAKYNLIYTISPGDLLANEFVLKNLASYIYKNKYDIIFGNAIPYNILDNTIYPLSIRNNPFNLFVYWRSRRQLIIDYLVCHDGILGATLFTKKDILNRFLKRMIGKVKYAEDFYIRIALAEDCTIGHMNEEIIWYEYGTGISTSKSNYWSEALKRDFMAAEAIIIESTEIYNPTVKSYRWIEKTFKDSKIIRRLLKLLIFPESIFLFFLAKYHPKMTTSMTDISFFNQCMEKEVHASN